MSSKFELLLQELNEAHRTEVQSLNAEIITLRRALNHSANFAQKSLDQAGNHAMASYQSGQSESHGQTRDDFHLAASTPPVQNKREYNAGRSSAESTLTATKIAAQLSTKSNEQLANGPTITAGTPVARRDDQRPSPASRDDDMESQRAVFLENRLEREEEAYQEKTRDVETPAMGADSHTVQGQTVGVREDGQRVPRQAPAKAASPSSSEVPPGNAKKQSKHTVGQILSAPSLPDKDKFFVDKAKNFMAKMESTRGDRETAQSKGYMSTEHLLRNLISNEVLSSDFRSSMGKLYKGLSTGAAPQPDQSMETGAACDIGSSPTSDAVALPTSEASWSRTVSPDAKQSESMTASAAYLELAKSKKHDESLYSSGRTRQLMDPVCTPATALCTDG
jgi:hypothetical protein